MSRLWSRLFEDRGFALPLALLVLLTTGALAVTVIEFSSSSGRTANIAKGRVSAEALAESGLANAFAVLNYWNDATQTNNAADPTLLGCDAAGTTCTPTVITYAGSGTATWYGVLNTTTSVWSVYSTGQVTNPTGGSALRKTLTAKVNVTWNNTQPANVAAWNYVYSTKAPGAGCEFDFEPNNNGGTIVIDIPIYVTGDLCFNSNNASIDEQGEGQVPGVQPIDIRVGGRIAYVKGGTVGVSGDNITSAAVAGGCSTAITGTTHTCARPGDAYFVDTNKTFQAIAAPVADFASYYQSASPGPKHPCVTATGPTNLAATTFESAGNTAVDASAATFDLTPGTSYQCKTYLNDASSGSQIGELSWVASTHVLTIRGVVFIDANLTSSDAQATYQGSGTIYLGGTFTFSGNGAKLCANPTCDFTTWNPNTEMLILAANGAGNSFYFNGNGDAFQGGLFCNPTGKVNFAGNNGNFQGPIICGGFGFSNNVSIKPLPAITELPLGAPSNPNVHAVPATPSYGG